ncbi:MAG: tetratricopeptide repeat protein [Pseudomonadota bacterium]|nr:tetratricopeptide repeat protein [Pseudomonadota bacterium]
MMLLAIATALASVEDRFKEANVALAAGELSAAEAGYRAVIEEGYGSGDIWYNLGNVLYRQERPAEAVLAWRTAAALLPRDPDIEANLDFARRGLLDGLIAPDPHPWFAPWQAAMTPDEGIWLGSALMGLGLIAVAARRRRPHLPWVPVGVGTSLLGALVAGGGVAEANLPPVGVLLVPEATATSDLGGGVDLFTLHAGAEVQTAEDEAGRTLVVLPDGRKGWLPSEALGLVDPSRPGPVL